MRNKKDKTSEIQKIYKFAICMKTLSEITGFLNIARWRSTETLILIYTNTSLFLLYEEA